MKLHISLAKQDLAKCGGWQAILLGMTELIRGLVLCGSISIQEESNLMTSMLCLLAIAHCWEQSLLTQHHIQFFGYHYYFQALDMCSMI